MYSSLGMFWMLQVHIYSGVRLMQLLSILKTPVLLSYSSLLDLVIITISLPKVRPRLLLCLPYFSVDQLPYLYSEILSMQPLLP